VVAALRLHGGALLAEPVGTGKTFIALAVAKALAQPVSVIVPAVLRSQWESALARLDITAAVTTHEQWSRTARSLAPGLVVVDEAHRLRNPGIRRYLHLAPGLVGRRVLLLTATPVVNVPDDLVHLLLLALRDDVLSSFGTPSIAEAITSGVPPAALAQVVVREMDADGIPQRVPGTVFLRRDRSLSGALRHLDGLELSRAPAIRTLIRTVFTTALASSRAAFREALDRYRLLLLQADDAARAGRALERRALRRILGGDLAQTVLWDLFDDASGTLDLVPRDLPRLGQAISACRRSEGRFDPKVERLRELLADGIPTVVFVSARATVAYLRDRLLPRSAVAWCTGAGAGIGPARLPRGQVLAWFRPGRDARHRLAPRILITTDVAAEGLDLQRAARIVHYDLPWTAVRLEQRAGRAARLGSPHASVRIIEFRPHPELERRLGLEEAINRKANDALRLGMGSAGMPLSWYRSIAASAGLEAGAGVAAVTSDEAGTLAGVEVWRGDARLGGLALYRDRNGRWTDAPTVVGAALRRAWDAPVASAVEPASLRREVATFLRHVESGRRMGTTALRPHHHLAGRSAIVRRVRTRALDAVRSRDHAVIAAVDRALANLARGWTAGERLRVDRLAQGDTDALIAGLEELPLPRPAFSPLRFRFVGLVRLIPAAEAAGGR
jgi:hypothetical protein